MDKNVSDPADEKVENQERQDVKKTTPGTDVISTAPQHDKTATVQTELQKTELPKTETSKSDETKSEVAQNELIKVEIDETKTVKTEAAKKEANTLEVAKTEVLQTDLTKTEMDKKEVAQAEVNKTEVAQTEVAQTDLTKTEINEKEVAQAEVNKTEVAQTEVAQTELVKTEMDKTEVTEVVETEIAKAEVDKTEVAKDKPKVSDTESKAVTTQPEIIKTDPQLDRTEPNMAKTELPSGPEVAKLEPEVNKATAADLERVSSGPDSSETGQPLARTEAKGEEGATREPLGSGSTARSSLRSAATRTRYSIESDSEISEILRDAPPPKAWEEEEAAGEDVPSETSGRGTGGGGGETGGGEVTGDTEMVIIMKKTFTESVMPDQEFIPISEESDNDASTRKTNDLCLETLTVLAKHTPHNVAKNLEKNERLVENGTGTVPEPETTSDGESVLSKAQMEAQDLTSEFRRLQYLLENLSAFSDLELAPPGELPSLPVPVEQNQDQVPEPSTLKTEAEVERK